MYIEGPGPHLLDNSIVQAVEYVRWVTKYMGRAYFST